MFGKKKTTGTATPVPQVSNKKKIEDCLTSMSFLSHFVIDKKESLVEEEIKTVREIDKVKGYQMHGMRKHPVSHMARWSSG